MDIVLERKLAGCDLRINAFNPFNNVRRINTNTSITYKANGPAYSNGFTIINTGAQLAAALEERIIGRR